MPCGGEPGGEDVAPTGAGAYILQSSFTTSPAKFFSWSTFTRRHSLALSCLENKMHVHRLQMPHGAEILPERLQWSSPHPQGTCAKSRGVSYCHTEWRGATACSGWRPGLLLNTPEGTARPPTESDPARTPRVPRNTRMTRVSKRKLLGCEHPASFV